MNDIKIIDAFEKKVAKYAGSRYAVAVSSGTNAIFLSLMLRKHMGRLNNDDVVTVPKNTYMSIPMSIVNAGLRVKFVDKDWEGYYLLDGTDIYDSAVKFEKNMYIKDSLYCLSFQYRKGLPIGRGGMILTDYKFEYDTLKQMRHNGKHPGISKWKDEFIVQGWDMYMLPEQAARGLTLLNCNVNEGILGSNKDYPDVSKQWKI